MSATLYTSDQSFHHNSFACLNDSDDESDNEVTITENRNTKTNNENNSNNEFNQMKSLQRNKTLPQNKIQYSDSITKFLKYIDSKWEDL